MPKSLTYEEAVLDACATSWIPTEGKSPKELLTELFLWEQRVALDPVVSEEARNLQLNERAKIVAWIRDGVDNKGWHTEYTALADSIESGEYEVKE